VQIVEMTQSLNWKLRRVAADIRQQDIATKAGISTTRYSAIERGESEPTKLEIRLIEQILPQLPMLTPGQARVDTRRIAM